MTDDKDSFDPRTWGKSETPDDRPSPPPPPSSANAESFDPRTWLSRELASKKTAPPTSLPAVDAAPRANHRPKAVVAIAAGLAVVAAGGGIALWHRQPATQPPPAASAGPAKPAAPQPGESTRTLVIAGPAALPAALVSLGVGQDDAHAAAAAAAPGLGKRTGSLRVAMTLAPGNRLVRMEVAFDDSAGAIVTRGADGEFQAAIQTASLDAHVCSSQEIGRAHV